MPECQAEGCDRPGVRKGCCGTHYAQLKRFGEFRPYRPRKRGAEHCAVPGCHKPREGHDYCAMHLARWRRHGDPLGGRRFNGDKLHCTDGDYCPAVGRLKNHLWQIEHPERVKEISRRHYAENRDDYIARANAASEEDRRRWKKAWKQANPGRVRADTLARKRGLARATPEWLTTDDYRAMAAVYEKAKMLDVQTGEPFHVDHIVPLRDADDLVCGLHVPWNLRAVPANANMRRPRGWLSIQAVEGDIGVAEVGEEGPVTA